MEPEKMILPRSGKISGSHVPVAVQISFSHAIPIQQPKLLDHLNIVLFIMEYKNEAFKKSK